jgi:predicted transcriptional regulator with HTH domain
MATNEKEIVNGIEVDIDEAQRLIKKVIVKEKRNLSTKEFGSAEMVKKIKKMIEEEVECY